MPCLVWGSATALFLPERVLMLEESGNANVQTTQELFVFFARKDPRTFRMSPNTFFPSDLIFQRSLPLPFILSLFFFSISQLPTHLREQYSVVGFLPRFPILYRIRYLTLLHLALWISSPIHPYLL